ncbi:hypothetical protein NOM01_02690 [Sporolactobacillus sp. STSJ-5]|uniref:hypothetical protein n=1 Tax=Sporolactobacillus sp. STSJ-5 TaxID=2965076 RepID=UPI0021044347|nr:hypothetical protein [Sporolactobacillus sp. STSJ-5]MCQ2008897.1 hypothetical protein [Sporolactobacillus sp. STSJ-5]
MGKIKWLLLEHYAPHILASHFNDHSGKESFMKHYFETKNIKVIGLFSVAIFLFYLIGFLIVGFDH